MQVIRLVHRFSLNRPGIQRPPVSRQSGETGAARITACGRAAPPAAVATLARRLATDPDATPSLSPTGLVAATISRPGRTVDTWLAWEPLPGEQTVAAVGLVTLVTACRGDHCRHSIGWLLVHPAVRRRGLGRLLVDAALAAADDQAATEVWVETRADWKAAYRFWRACGFTPP